MLEAVSADLNVIALPHIVVTAESNLSQLGIHMPDITLHLRRRAFACRIVIKWCEELGTEGGLLVLPAFKQKRMQLRGKPVHIVAEGRKVLQKGVATARMNSRVALRIHKSPPVGSQRMSMSKDGAIEEPQVVGQDECGRCRVDTPTERHED